MSSRWGWPVSPVVAGTSSGRRVQYAALPYRVRRDGEVQIRLITSRETRRWVIPKGWPIKGLTPPKTAAREAYEEAGLVGVVSREPLGLYTYEKRLGTRSVLCDVLVFPLKVKRSLQKWPERFQRFGFWFSIDSAAAAVQEEDLSELIRAFGALMARRWAAKLEEKTAAAGKGVVAPATAPGAGTSTPAAAAKKKEKAKGSKEKRAGGAEEAPVDFVLSAAEASAPDGGALSATPAEPTIAAQEPSSRAKASGAKAAKPKESKSKGVAKGPGRAEDGRAAGRLPASGARVEPGSAMPQGAAGPQVTAAPVVAAPVASPKAGKGKASKAEAGRKTDVAPGGKSRGGKSRAATAVSPAPGEPGAPEGARADEGAPAGAPSAKEKPGKAKAAKAKPGKTGPGRA